MTAAQWREWLDEARSEVEEAEAELENIRGQAEKVEGRLEMHAERVSWIRDAMKMAMEREGTAS